jgi:hypothetical protein
VLAGDKSAIALVYPYRCVLCSSVTHHGAEESHLREAGQRETAVIAGPPPFQAEIPEDVEQRHPQSLLDPGQPHHRKGGVHFPLHLGRVACQGGERQQRIFVASQFPELSGAQPSHQGDLRGEVEVSETTPIQLEQKKVASRTQRRRANQQMHNQLKWLRKKRKRGR